MDHPSIHPSFLLLNPLIPKLRVTGTPCSSVIKAHFHSLSTHSSCRVKLHTCRSTDWKLTQWSIASQQHAQSNHIRQHFQMMDHVNKQKHKCNGKQHVCNSHTSADWHSKTNALNFFWHVLSITLSTLKKHEIRRVMTSNHRITLPIGVIFRKA